VLSPSKYPLFFVLLFGVVDAETNPRRWSQLPLRFEPNRGQVSRETKFVARAGGYALLLNASEAVVSAESGQIRMRLEGSNAAARLTGERLLDGHTNYLLGPNKSEWITGVPGYARVRRSQVYPGIDLVYYGRKGQLEYDFVIRSGADPNRIRMRFDGAAGLRIDGNGDLLITTATGTLRQQRPLIYQEIGGRRRPVHGGYRLDGRSGIRFEVARYDARRALVIDPVLTFGSYLGSSGDEDSFGALAVDATGAIYLGGQSVKLPNLPADFPVTPGAYQQNSRSNADAVLTKISPDGSRLVYSTYLGGQLSDTINGVAVHTDGTLYFCGTTFSNNFPVTAGAFQATFGGGNADAFVGRLSANGSELVFSTFVGGAGVDTCTDVVLSLPQRLTIGLTTDSAGLRTSANAAQAQKSTAQDLYFLSLNADGTTLVNATYLGGTGVDELNRMRLDGQGNLLAVGRTSSANFPVTAGSPARAGANDALVVKLDSSLAPVFARLIGGGGEDAAIGVTSDVSNNIYVVGDTDSSNFPTTAGVRQTAAGGGVDAFVAKFSPAGSVLFATLLGGSAEEAAYAVAVDRQGNITAVGHTFSTNFPLTGDAWQTATKSEFDNEYPDAFLVRLNPTGSDLLFSTLLGGNYGEISTALFVDDAGIATWAGTSSSDDFQVTAGAVQTTLGSCRVDLDSGCSRFFIARVDLNRALPAGPRILYNGVLNAADYTRGGVAVGDIITLFGLGMGPANLVGLQLNADRTVSRNLAGTRVLFDGVEAPIIYTSAGQVSTVVPYRLAGAKTTSVVVEYQGVRSAPLVLPIRPSKMALFTLDSSGGGPAAALNADNSVNSASNSVVRGSVIVLYGTGLGVLQPAPGDTTLIGTPLPLATAKVTATIGDKSAKVLYAGGAPGLVAGVVQINLEVPADAPTGAAVEVIVRVGEDAYPSQDGVTIAVR
jgi:uncharacterized protein (TIGR03437 family)